MSNTVTFDDVWKMFQETDKKFQEMKLEAEKDRQETNMVLRNLSKQLGSLGSKWSEFVENMVAPACKIMFAERGIPVHQIHPRVKAKLDGGRNMEVDVLVVNHDVLVLVVVEVKSTLTVSDVQDHIEHLKQFKDFFPQYKQYRVMGAVAGMRVDENVENFAQKEGLFVIAQSGDTVTLKNNHDFKPRSW